MALWRDADVEARTHRLELPFNRYGYDRYGLSRRDLGWAFSLLKWFYSHYFHVTAHGLEHVPARGRAMLVGNHSGGVAVDAMMVLGSLMFELEPPRLGQGMAEKFIAGTPFGSMLTSRLGQLTGLPEHAERLLRDERLLMVFPEGARGTAKLYWDRNSLVGFGTGFMRLAMATRSPIVPFGFVGGGDAIPTIRNLYGLGKLIGAPYIPVTPYLLPIPRPVPLQIYYSEPMLFEGNGNEDDETIQGYVEQVRQRIAGLLEAGEAKR